jgi:hypothetical protein
MGALPGTAWRGGDPLRRAVSPVSAFACQLEDPMRLSRLVPGVAAAGTALAAATAAPPPAPPANQAPGRYVTERGWGRLRVEASRPGEVGFDIDAVGSNAHECQLQGSARAGAASVDAGDGSRCGVRFQVVPGGVDVDADDSAACRGFCGARAWFPGRYLVEPADCGDKARARVRASFEALYKARRYDEAVKVLQPQLAACGRFLDRSALWAR